MKSQPSWKKLKPLAGEFSSSFWELSTRFGQSSTIHGVNRLFNPKAGKCERCIWLLTIMVALFGSISICILISARYTEGKLETVIDATRKPVYEIPFPVVTICNNNALNWQRFEAAKQRFLKPNETPKNQDIFELIVANYDNLKFGTFQNFGKLRNLSVEPMNYVNFSQVIEFMTWHCEELLSQCFWKHFAVNCCDIFYLRRSKNGLCWAFNTLETEAGRERQKLDPLWPWHSGDAGPESGLTVRVLINEEKHYPKSINEKGVQVMITEQNVWHFEPLSIPANTYTNLEIDPAIYSHDSNTRRLGPILRKCWFNDEIYSENFRTLQGYVYMIENCESECHQQYLVKYCNCTMDLLFPPGPYPICKATDLLCLAQNNDRFAYSQKGDERLYVHNHQEYMICNCLLNCYSLNYAAVARPLLVPALRRSNKSFIELDVHYRLDIMMVYRTGLVFDWVDLMAAFGGIVGLFLGCSLISTMELAYFLLMDLPKFVLRKYCFNKNKLQSKQQLLENRLRKKNISKHTRQLNMKNKIMQQQSYARVFYNNQMHKKLAHNFDSNIDMYVE
ncbi:pickpocket protein 19-like [Rhagoletis pomonella]|uniref:pickpocket protein 19-like n=1 Tax=Rhagoletis pomonella TaxID=28610 RepID=UPI001783E85F|nr:pickpocket protein 19-like [Rhagoletis pomonella]